MTVLPTRRLAEPLAATGAPGPGASGRGRSVMYTRAPPSSTDADGARTVMVSLGSRPVARDGFGLLLDDVHGGLLGRGGSAVDADVTPDHLVVHVLVTALVRCHEASGALVADLRVADEVVLGGDRVGVVAANPVLVLVVEAALVVRGAVGRGGVGDLLLD